MSDKKTLLKHETRFSRVSAAIRKDMGTGTAGCC